MCKNADNKSSGDGVSQSALKNAVRAVCVIIDNLSFVQQRIKISALPLAQPISDTIAEEAAAIAAGRPIPTPATPTIHPKKTDADNGDDAAPMVVEGGVATAGENDEDVDDDEDVVVGNEVVASESVGVEVGVVDTETLRVRAAAKEQRMHADMQRVLVTRVLPAIMRLLTKVRHSLSTLLLVWLGFLWLNAALSCHGSTSCGLVVYLLINLQCSVL